MKISTKGRYALRLMLDLAMHDTGEYVALKTVSERQHISVKYLEQIISSLVKAGLLKGLRGSKGGYKLSRRPDEYTVGEILRVTEGSLSPIPCLDDEENLCEYANVCLTLPFWEKLNEAIKSVVDSTSLEDLLKDYKFGDGSGYII